jgi:hypothetical protein
MNNILSIPEGVQFFKKQLHIPEGLIFEQWYDLGRYLAEMRRSVNFWQTKHVRYGRGAYGEERTAEALKQMDFEFQDVKAMDALLKLDGVAHAELTAEHHFVAARADVTPEQKETWLDIAEKEKLTPAELRVSMIKGVVTRAETGGGRDSGVGSPHAVRQQFDFWMREIEDRWEKLPPDQLEALHGLLRPIAEFVLRLEQKMAAGEEARAPFNDKERVIQKVRFHFPLGSEVSLAKIQRKLRLGYNAASVAFDALVDSGEVAKGIRVK